MTVRKKAEDNDGEAVETTISFADAMDELDRIVAELENDEVDVDLMAQRVERAALLVGLCRDRLDATRFKVEEIIVALDETPGDGGQDDDLDAVNDDADTDNADSDA